MHPPRLAADDPRLDTRHLLALPDDVVADEVEALALSRFLGARWDTPVPTTAPRGRAARDPLAGVGVLRLSRHSSAAGPFALTADDVVRLGLPDDTATAFLVSTPRERGEPPYPGGDRDGLKRAFPDGMPVRDEERVLRWLVDAARRLGGAVRVVRCGQAREDDRVERPLGTHGTSSSDPSDAVVLVPDPDAATDLTVHSAVSLEPAAALAVVQGVAPSARLATDPTPWEGSAVDPTAPHPTEHPAGVTHWGVRPDGAPSPVLGERVRRRLHNRASTFDAEALAGPDALDGYGLEVAQGDDGVVVVEVGGEEAPGDEVLPVVLRGLAWAADGVTTYRVRWEPPDVAELEREHPTPEHRAARDRVQPLVVAVTRALHAAVGGEVVDGAEFLVEPADL